MTPAGTLAVTIRSRAYGLAALAGFSPTPGLKVFGKAGVARAEAKASPVGTGFVEVSGGATERTTTGVYGLGLTYKVTGNVTARAEYDVHKDLGGDAMGGKFDVKSASLALQFSF